MHPQPSVRFELLINARNVAQRATMSIMQDAREAIALRGRFRVLLAGGTTPMAVYRNLCEETAAWESWEVYFGDERCLPWDDPGRNVLAAREALLDRVPIPRDRIFEIPVELGPERAAVKYTGTVAAALPFDLVLLGMGEDGHTASLFPRHTIPEHELVIPVFGAPKPPPERVSLTPGALSSCRKMLVLVTGAGKREALAAWRRGADLPVSRVAAAGGALVLMDRAAAGG